jgi:alkylation response protein AidB-like acyl-CoA dehydrogenase
MLGPRAGCRLRTLKHANPRPEGQGGYVLTGTKMWITNSPIADVFVIWAKSDAHDGDPWLRARKGAPWPERPEGQGRSCRFARRLPARS